MLIIFWWIFSAWCEAVVKAIKSSDKFKASATPSSVIELSLSASPSVVDQGGAGELNVGMSNPYDVYGFELHITDVPDALSFDASSVVYGDLISSLENVPSGAS